MLVRPSRQAHAPLKREREDSDVKYGVFINEMNSYYRVGGTAWYPYKQTNGETGMWPVILLRIMSPKNQADMIEVGGVLLYSGEYLDQHCCSGFYKRTLPYELRGNNIWFVSNVAINLSSDQTSSAWTGIPVRYCAVGGLTSMHGLRIIPSYECEFTADPNGLHGEELLIAGSVKLQLQQTPKVWKHELLSFELLNSDAQCRDFTSLIP